MRLSEPALAKLNLALHVRRRRADGYHDLETLFAFCTDGDMLHVETSERLGMAIEGPFAPGLSAGSDNLVWRAAELLAQAADVEARAAITLDKRLPIASGIGGGSADAAAALRLLTRFWKIDPGHAAAVAPRLGADVPACLLSMTTRGTGVGEQLEVIDVGSLSGTAVLLVNPRIPLSTPQVFAVWDGMDRGPLADWREGRNDLQQPAISLVPEIGEVLQWLEEQPGAAIARMSGSGATCFALFDSEADRTRAAFACPEKWWNLATFLR
ncbi:4-(cytidine 5'-diphospho)-2-C-methyl-D-erythritol kinase [Sphingomonas jaspsi]|uniref:4-(cytidine 5'-diphospho)-2-C-methyl-D-erythritol kinase n=1 Tax=Sphingomonas jaspsi TaxID=392409 RepID=UPI0004BC8C5A|nr:4-(cytidine 5'-diphospho)-2-C-methyl-D-erythritol kinase [Sphingomonas jaspsi]